MKKEEVTKLGYSPSIKTLIKYDNVSLGIKEEFIAVTMTDHGELIAHYFYSTHEESGYNEKSGKIPLFESDFHHLLEHSEIINLEKKLIVSHIEREKQILSESADLIVMNYPKLFDDKEVSDLKKRLDLGKIDIKTYTEYNKHCFDFSNTLLEYIMEADTKEGKQNPNFLFLYRECPIMFAGKELSPNPYFMKRILLDNYKSNFINSKMLKNPSLRKKSSSSGFNRLDEAKNFFQDYSNFLKELIIKETQVTNYLSGKTENSGESIKLTDILKRSSVTAKKMNKAQRKAFKELKKFEGDLSSSNRYLTDFELHYFFGMGKDADEAMKRAMERTGKMTVGGDCDLKYPLK